MIISWDAALIFCAALLSAYIVRRVWPYIWAGLLVFGFYTLFNWLLISYIGTDQPGISLDELGESAIIGRLRNESKIAELLLEIVGKPRVN